MSLFAYIHRACGGFGFFAAPGATVRCYYCGGELATGELVELHPAAEQAVAAVLGFTVEHPPESTPPPAAQVREALQEIVDRVRGAVRAAETPSAQALARALYQSVLTAMTDHGLCTRGR